MAMKPFRVATLAVAVVAIAATVASAIPSFSPSSNPSRDPDPVAAVLSSRMALLPQGEVAIPDHSACGGLTGLENAACRVEANLEAHPNFGLANAIGRLDANLAAHATRRPDPVASGAAMGARGIDVAVAHGALVAAR